MKIVHRGALENSHSFAKGPDSFSGTRVGIVSETHPNPIHLQAGNSTEHIFSLKIHMYFPQGAENI